LADDQPEIIETVTRLLKDDFDVIAAVTNGNRVIEADARLKPDLLVLDISMPGMNGIEAASRLKESGSKARIIFLTVNEDPYVVEAALSAGALGYVLKKGLISDLIPAIRQALQDRVFVSPMKPAEKNHWPQPVMT
jgi:DNA-binding NarL/FixJ family response regulator